MTCESKKDAMVCEFSEQTCPGDCSECSECQPLSSEASVSRSIDYSVAVLYEMEQALGADAKLENVQINVNGARLVSICESLLAYAECYDDVDVAELFKMCSAVDEFSTAAQYNADTVH